MKSLALSLAILSIVVLLKAKPLRADPEGSSKELAVAASLQTCHAPIYDSYFVAQNVKDNLKSVNADLTRPNFAGHYLLLRAELAMETLYLIADCDTGKFFHEKLSADRALYWVNSNQVELSNSSGEKTHYEWDGRSWIKGETVDAGALTLPNAVAVHEKTSASPNPKSGVAPYPSATPSLSSAYQAMFTKFPALEFVAGKPCAELDYASFFRAENHKQAIIHANKDLSHSNFAGNKLLLRTETLFNSLYLIADCATGKFSDEILQGNLLFDITSRLVVIKSSDNHPDLVVWSDTQWIHTIDPLQNHKETVKNILYGDKAMSIVRAVPNPDRKDIVRFENLSIRPELSPLFRELGVDTVNSGECRIPYGKSSVCTITTQ